MGEVRKRPGTPNGRELKLDHNLKDTFPASDPPSWSAEGTLGADRPPGEVAYPPGMDPHHQLGSSPSMLDADTRARICESLLQRVCDGVDLHTQIKVAHWNVKGAQFSALHLLFDKMAADVQEYNDELAERAVTLGARVEATARQVAARSRLSEYPGDAHLGPEHVRALIDRLETYIDGATEALRFVDGAGDRVTADELSDVLASLEKYGWMLRATLEGSEHG